MLTRYKQLYNQLTHSEAFGKNGGFDGHKINKRTFTPHNLRALLFGANGAIAVYYTTNKLENYKVRYIDIHSSFMNTMGTVNPQNYQEAIKEDKGMIDALYFSKGLNFNYVEEIFFFTEGFENQEIYNKEYIALNRFANDTKVLNSMKRLRGIYLVNDIISRAYLDVVKADGETIYKRLKSANIPIPIKPIREYNPERTELGLLVNRGLDGKEYLMDTKYTPDLDEKEGEKEQYRLSRYFYKEEQRALAEKKRREEESKKKEYDEQLIRAANSTIQKLDMFYAPLWNGRYSGIIYDGGVLFSKSNTVNNNRKMFQAMYDAWKEFAFGNLEAENVNKVEANFNAGYNPGMHRNNLSSKDNWNKHKQTLKEKLLEEYAKHYESNPNIITAIDRSLTNCLVIEARSQNQIILRMTGIEKGNIGLFKKTFDEYVGNTYLGSSEPGLIADTEYKNGILTLTYIKDFEAFSNEVLFAYKIYNSGLKPSLTNALVGLKMNGKPITINLLETGKILTSIVAGSRSGKGTMTMGLLAALFGAGGSIVYLDNKPDIGAMLWDLEREYADKGLKLLSIDIGNEYQEFTGATPVRTGEMNLIPEDLDDKSLFRTLRMAKLFQLVHLIGSRSSDIEKQLGISTQNLFFIADELTSTNLSYSKLCLYAEKKMTDYGKLAAKAKASEEEKNLFAYYKKLNNVLSRTSDKLVEGLTKDYGQSGVKIIIIGQELNSKWKVPKVNFTKSFVGKLVDNSHFSFSGRGQSTTETFRFTPEQAKLAKNSGVFNFNVGKPCPLDNTVDMDANQIKDFTQFRSYFSLVKNDFNYDEFINEGVETYLTTHTKRFTTQFLNSYASKGQEVMDRLVNELYDKENNCNREEVSFTGLLKVMQNKTGMDDATLISNMNKGYNLVDAVFRKLNLGDYSCVEEYLCDCSPESLFTQEELTDRFYGIVKDEKPENKSELNDSFSIMDEDANVDVTASKPSQHSFTVDGAEMNKNENPVLNQKSTPTSSSPVTSPQDNNSQRPQRPQRPNQPINTQNTSQNDRYTVSDKNYYRGKIDVQDNPFTKYTSGSNTDTLLTVKDMTRILMDDIRKNVCPDDMVTSFMIADSTLFINEVIYEPTFDNAFMQSLPQSLRMKVENGQMAEFFDLRQVYKYKNLEKFGLMDELLAQGRARKEMAIGFRKRWSVLFRKFKRLQLIQVGDIKYFRENPDSNAEDGLLEKFKNNPALTYAKGNGAGFMDKVWDSRPVRAITRGLGWTMGVQTVWFAASLMGPWGLLFGAIAAASVYNDTKKRNQMNNNYENGNSNKKSSK